MGKHIIVRDDEGELTEETKKAIKEAMKSLRKNKGMTTEEVLTKLELEKELKNLKRRSHHNG